MSAKRAATRSPASSAAASPVIMNLVALSAAIAFGTWLLVSSGRLSWPPTHLLADGYTLAGCLALAGPIVLFRRDPGDGGIGETLWMTGGLMVWVFNLAMLARGEARVGSLATPVAARTMGLVILAVLVASWRTRGANRSWSWTNVTGWALGLYWVGLGLVNAVPGGTTLLASR